MTRFHCTVSAMKPVLALDFGEFSTDVNMFWNGYI